MAERFNDYRRHLEALFTLATAIGDGCIGIPKQRPNSRYLSFTHSARQREYLQYKLQRVNEELGTTGVVSEAREIFDSRTGKSYQSCQAMVVSPVLRDHYALLYPRGKKEYTERLLGILGLEALAVFWMDDGCVVRSRYARNRGLLASYCSKQEASLLCEWINGLVDVGAVPYKDRRYYRVRVNASRMPRLATALRPFVHSSMAYKVSLEFSHYNTCSRREYEASLTIPFVDKGDKAARARDNG